MSNIEINIGGKIHEKQFWGQIWAEVAKIRPETRFFAIF